MSSSQLTNYIFQRGRSTTTSFRDAHVDHDDPMDAMGSYLSFSQTCQPFSGSFTAVAGDFSAFFRRTSFLLLKLHHFRGDTVVFQVQLSMSKMRISPTRMPYGKLTVCELEDGHL